MITCLHYEADYDRCMVNEKPCLKVDCIYGLFEESNSISELTGSLNLEVNKFICDKNGNINWGFAFLVE